MAEKEGDLPKKMKQRFKGRKSTSKRWEICGVAVATDDVVIVMAQEDFAVMIEDGSGTAMAKGDFLVTAYGREWFSCCHGDG